MFLISKGVVDGISYKKETKVQYVHQEFWTTTSTLKEKILHGIFFFIKSDMSVLRQVPDLKLPYVEGDA